MNETMKLSEAIRLGAMLGPQAFGVLEDGDATCALGAVGVAMEHVEQFRPFLFGGNGTLCPACQEPTAFRGYVILHLNDDHRWTRERIADFVETLEPADAPAAQLVTEAKGSA